MADVSNTFEGGSNGTTITTGNSGGASGSAFNFVGIVAGGAATYTTTAYRGTLAGSFASAGTAGTVLAEYTTSLGAASTGQVYGRLRFRLPSLPPDSTGVRVAVITDSTGSFRAEIRVNNVGAVSIRGSAGSALATFTDTYAAGTWWDVGLAITVFSATVGVIEGKKYDSSGAVSQTIASSANQNTTGAGGTNKAQVGMVRSLANYTVLVDDAAWSTSGYPSLPSAASPAVAYGPWSGAVTDTAFTAVYVLEDTTSARLVVSTASDLSSPVFSSAVAPDADGVVKLTISGLTAGTVYHFGVEADGTVLAGDRGEVTTFPTAGTPADFSVAFGSCQFDAPSDSTFAAILAKTDGASSRAKLLIHMGDMNYQDWDGSATAADVFDQHMTSLGSASMAGMLAKIPINYLWDNHDWGGNTSDATAAAGDVVADTYRQVFPHYSLPATDGRGGYHSWVIGRVRFIQLDVRSYRDPQSSLDGASKTMLGSEQKAWLEDRLLDDEPVKVICGNYPWRDDGDGSGRWGSYVDEFSELSDYIDANVPGQVYVIFGDRHFLAADDGSSAGTRGVPQAGGAPFQQSSTAVADTWSQGSYTISPSTLQAYGWLDVTDDGDLITIEYSGITSLDGTTRVSMTTVFDTLVSGTSASTLPAVTSTATGTAQTSGASTATLPAVTSTGAATARTAGVSTAALPAVVSTAIVDARTSGTAISVLPAVTSTATGASRSAGTSAAALPATISAATGVAQSVGVSTAVLAPAIANATATATGRGVSAATLPAVIASGTGQDVRPAEPGILTAGFLPRPQLSAGTVRGPVYATGGG